MNEFTDDTGFLFAEPTFLSGIASLFDLSGSLVVYNESKTGQEADRRALASDWAVVGKDIRTAAKTLVEQEAQKP
jgi:acetylornithine/succinyldiaminopimelate/putrescine aminotransferase